MRVFGPRKLHPSYIIERYCSPRGTAGCYQTLCDPSYTLEHRILINARSYVIFDAMNASSKSLNNIIPVGIVRTFKSSYLGIWHYYVTQTLFIVTVYFSRLSPSQMTCC